MGQEADEKWTAAVNLQPTLPKPDRLLDTGYPDSTHFSHSIRQVYGLNPRDLFAGSRALTVLGDSPAARAAARAEAWR